MKYNNRIYRGYDNLIMYSCEQLKREKREIYFRQMCINAGIDHISNFGSERSRDE